MEFCNGCAKDNANAEQIDCFNHIAKGMGLLGWEKKIPHYLWPDSVRNGAEDLPIQHIRCGLIAMRHQIVHGPNSPDPKTIKPLAIFAETFLAEVLCPTNGIASQGIRDPLKKCSRFRKQASAVSNCT